MSSVLCVGADLNKTNLCLSFRREKNRIAEYVHRAIVLVLPDLKAALFF